MTTTTEADYLRDTLAETERLITHFEAAPIDEDTPEFGIDQSERRKGLLSDLRARRKELEEEIEAL